MEGRERGCVVYLWVWRRVRSGEKTVGVCHCEGIVSCWVGMKAGGEGRGTAPGMRIISGLEDISSGE